MGYLWAIYQWQLKILGSSPFARNKIFPSSFTLLKEINFSKRVMSKKN